MAENLVGTCLIAIFGPLPVHQPGLQVCHAEPLVRKDRDATDIMYVVGRLLGGVEDLTITSSLTVCVSLLTRNGFRD